MTVLHLTVTDDDVLGGLSGKASLSTLTTVVVTGALDGDTVVAGIEIAVLNQYTVTRLRVATVTIRTVVVDMHPTYRDVGRQQGMDDPERRA